VGNSDNEFLSQGKLSPSATRAAAAARVCRQGSKPQEMASSCFDKPLDSGKSLVAESGSQELFCFTHGHTGKGLHHIQQA
jgi:hypothetical protein